MSIAVPSSSLADLPIVVQDRRRRGFYTVDNEVIDRYGAVLKAYGVAVYNVLARFANREGECFPSQSTIAERLGMSRMQVSREIDKLQRLQLIEVKPQIGLRGEQRANLYILCDVPTSEAGNVIGSYTPCNTQLHPPITGSYTPCNTQLHKQDLENKTQKQNKTQRTTHRANNNTSSGSTTHPLPVGGADVASNLPTVQQKTCKTTKFKTIQNVAVDVAPLPNSGDPLSPVLEQQQTPVSALLAVGMTAKVAKRLAERYSLEHLEEKLNYLDFLQLHAANKIKNPCGWLRKAIEDDFAAPDGYRSPAEQAEQLAAELAWADQLLAPSAPQERLPTLTETLVPPLQAQYGTTDVDHLLWQQMLSELAIMSRTYLYNLLREAGILRFTDDKALIWVQDTFQRNLLGHPQTQIVLSRTLTQVAGRPLVPAFVVLDAAGE